MIYKDKNTALWCECGNKEHLLGFAQKEDECQCIECGAITKEEDIELRTEPEVKV